MLKKFRNKKNRELSLKLDACLYDIDCLLDDVENLQETLDETLEIVKQLQKQSNMLCQMVDKMNNKPERTLEEIVDNIEKLVGKDNAKE